MSVDALSVATASRRGSQDGIPSAGTKPVTVILAAGVGMGALADSLLRAPGEPGLNVAVLFAGLAAAVGMVSANGGPRLSREALGWTVAGVVFGAGLAWRGSEMLRFLAFASALVAFTLPAVHAGRAWVQRAGMADLLEAVAASGFHAVLGPAPVLVRARSTSPGVVANGRTVRPAGRSLAVGLLLALVPLTVFGALFLSADPIFADILRTFVTIDLRAFASHVIVIAVLSWIACGYLSGFCSGTRLNGLRARGWHPLVLRTGEVAVALGLVDLLFLAFVIVQFRYLFGGAELVEVTPGLTYAAYAREGFFQLVAATALGLPWLLAADSLLGEGEGSARWSFRALAGAQLVLLLAIVASALQRMRGYLEAYGLTEDRFIATAVLLWLALLVIGFGVTVLRGRRNPFVPGALLSGYGLVAVLQVSNPAAYAVRSHLDRASASLPSEGDSGSRLDVGYLVRLGSDATPILVERMNALPGPARCEVAEALLSRWGPAEEWDWRNWNLAEWNARKAVGAEAERLRAMVRYRSGCGQAAEAAG